GAAGATAPPRVRSRAAPGPATGVAAAPASARLFCGACLLPLAWGAGPGIAAVFENRRRSFRAVRFDFRSPAVAGSGRAASRSARQAVIVAQVAGATVVVVAPPWTVVVVVPLAWMPISNVVV